MFTLQTGKFLKVNKKFFTLLYIVTMTDKYFPPGRNSLLPFTGNVFISINGKEINSSGKQAERGGKKVIKETFYCKKEANLGFEQKY